MTAIMLPAVQAARQAARRANCTNNMTQINLALQAYYAEKGHFPPAFVADKNGKPMHSWRVLLLPYLDQKAIYDQYDMNQPWNSPHNLALANQMPAIYRCPNNSSNTPGITNYAMLVGPKAISTGPQGRTKDEITHGLASTIIVAETTGNHINWLDPEGNLDVETMTFDLMENDGNEISSEDPNFVTVGFCDGQVHILSKTSDSRTIKSMTSIDGDSFQPTPKEEEPFSIEIETENPLVPMLRRGNTIPRRSGVGEAPTKFESSLTPKPPPQSSLTPVPNAACKFPK